MAVRYGAHPSWLAGTCLTALYRGTRLHLYEQAFKAGATQHLQPAGVYGEARGRYPMQMQWLQRTLSYRNKLVANKANSELLDFVLAAEVHQGLFLE
jgi:hypothetical protein